MTLVRSRKARILEKSGLRYVAGWVKSADAAGVLEMIEAEKPKVAEVLKDES